MRNVFRPGDKKEHRMVVKPEDMAAFNGVVVHEVCSTFALAREVEWTTRQFVLDMKDDDEEGIGTRLEIEHLAPVLVGEEIVFAGRFECLRESNLECSFEARVGGRLVARGRTGQKILKKEGLKTLFNHG